MDNAVLTRKVPHCTSNTQYCYVTSQVTETISHEDIRLLRNDAFVDWCIGNNAADDSAVGYHKSSTVYIVHI
jgi:hypothetical protein